MTLLEDVIAGASGTAPISSLLRQLKVLASRTGGDRLDEWVVAELEGYGPDDVVPRYRGPFALTAYAHFVGAGGVQVKNAQIPPVTFPEDMRASVFEREFRNSIAEIEDMARSDIVRLGWSADIVQLYNRGVASGMIRPFVRSDLVCVEVVTPVPSHILVGIIDAVRSRTLDLALEVERAVPLAGQVSASPDERHRAATIINNHFHASSNVAIGSPGSTLTIGLPRPGDAEALLQFLDASGIGAAALEALEALKRAIETDEASGAAGQGRWGAVREWFSDAITDLGTGTVAGTLAVAATIFLGSL